MSDSVLATLERLGSTQRGVVTAAQARRFGISHVQLTRLCQRNIIKRERRGVYLLPSAIPRPLTDLQAAWVSLDPEKLNYERPETEIVVSHESAAWVHNIGNLVAHKHTFSSVARKQSTHDDIMIYSNRNLSARDVISHDGLPVTSIPRTVADLAQAGIEQNYLALVVTDALRKEDVRFRDLAEHLDPFANRYGYGSGSDLMRACQREATALEDVQELCERLGVSVARDEARNIIVGLGLADTTSISTETTPVPN